LFELPRYLVAMITALRRFADIAGVNTAVYGIATGSWRDRYGIARFGTIGITLSPNGITSIRCSRLDRPMPTPSEDGASISETTEIASDLFHHKNARWIVHRYTNEIVHLRD
jgi:hypothetical protein